MTGIVNRRAAVLFLLAVSMAGCSMPGCNKSKEGESVDLFTTTKVERRDIEIKVTATGSIEPIRVIEIKSKASGEILALPVETGDVVSAGALLAQVDTTDVAAAYRQARADLEVARVRESVSRKSLDRAADLLARGMTSTEEYDQARLDYATARANVIRAETDLETKTERMIETIVRAPSTGTILKKNVEKGQIIASVGQVNAGTTLMTMADLSSVQVRAMVDETDVGKLRPGLPVTVTVDAFPGRNFTGEIQKIEPQSVEEQNVTFFPMIVQIPNSEGLLRPGMNASVDVQIMKKTGVPSLPNDAIKTLQNAGVVGMFLGLNPDSVNAFVDANKAKFMDHDSTRRGPGRRGGPGPGMANAPSESSARGARPSGATARARPSRGGSMHFSSRDIPQGPAPGVMAAGSVGVVFVPDSATTKVVLVKTGIQNWEYTEITSGLKEGDTVYLPPSAALAMQSQAMRDRLKQFSVIPGRSSR
ncbi:MAG TPA: efflux RND transporter periplasmic adaptor subunit [Candidatus Latescibacteria bacterium]|nr:efflux RND transporter periplasmic adaptor subunit [Candidatus Latescibacterota bacterium]